MKTALKITLSVVGIFIILLACTNKEINLITNVELGFSQENTAEGLVNQPLSTTLTITPEVFLPEFVYSFQYEVLEGDGVFLNALEETLPAGEPIILERTTEQDTNFILDLNYQAKSAGVNKVKVTASDNFEKSFSVVLSYTIKDIPVVWELNSELTTADEQQEIPITLTLEQKTIDPDITYQVRYTFEEGSGTLQDANGNNITLNTLRDISLGTQNLTLIANAVGTTTLQAELIDSNNQSIPTTISFTILELDTEPPVITLVGTNPLMLLTGSTYKDPGVTLTDNRDTAEQLQENLVVDSSEVDTSVPDLYTVTYTVTDQAGNEQTATRVVQIEINMTDVPFFSVKGNASNSVEEFTTELELGTVYEAGNLIGLTDNGTIEDQGIEDTNGLDGTTPIIGEYTVRYFATDNDGNTTAIVETVIVADTTPPTFRIIGLEADFNTQWNAGDVYTARAFDAITDASTTENTIVTDPVGILGTALATGTYKITYTVTDAVDLSKSITETLIVTDGESPIFEVRNTNVTPPTIEITDFETTLELGTPYEEGMIQNVEDNSGEANTTPTIDAPGNINSPTYPSISGSPYTITYSVVDQEGNNTQIVETVTVIDTTDPIFSVQQDEQNYTESFETTIEFGGTYNVGLITGASDLSGVTELIAGDNLVDTNNDDTYIVRYTVTDQSPNANSFTIEETVIVNPENQPPTFEVSGNTNNFTTTVELGQSYTPGTITNIMDDNPISDMGSVSGDNLIPSPTNAIQSYNVSYSVTDDGGLTTEIVETVNIEDNTPPTFAVQQNGQNYITNFETTVELGNTYQQGIITNVNDNDANPNSEISDSENINNAEPVIRATPYTIIYSVIDQNNNSTTITETVTVVDTTNPTFSVQKGAQNYPANFETTIEFGGTYNVGVITGASDLSGVTELITGANLVNTSAEGTYDVIYTVTDQSSNNNEKLITEKVIVGPDNEPAVAVDDPSVTVVENKSGFPTSVEIPVTGNDTNPDNLGLSVSVASIDEPDDGTVAINGSIITYTPNIDYIGGDSFIYTLTDSDNNPPTRAKVTIQVTKAPDQTNPTITLTGSPTINLELNVDSYNEQGAIISDNEPLTNTIATVSGTVDITSLGNYTITYTGTDAAGNPADPVERTVNVRDTQNPVITLTGLATISLFIDDTYNEQGATVTDNNPATASSASVGGDTVNTSIAGTYTVTYNASDPSNNSASQVSRTVTVTKKPLVVTLTASKTSVGTGENVTFTTQVSNANGPVTYSWNIGGTSSTNSRSYPTEGTKTVTVTVTAGSETDSDSIGINVSDPDPLPCGQLCPAGSICNGICCVPDSNPTDCI